MEEIKRLGKYFVLVFLASFLIINWQEILIISNYKVISHKISQEVNASVEAGKTGEMGENRIEIPKIGITAPIVLAEDENQQGFEKALEGGVLLYPSSVPGEEGETIILGHSAPPGWPDIKYENIFSNLSQLNKGDEIYIYFGGHEYFYRVRAKLFLDKGEEIPGLTNSQSELTLLSCWPPGKDRQRIVIKAGL